MDFDQFLEKLMQFTHQYSLDNDIHVKINENVIFIENLNDGQTLEIVINYEPSQVIPIGENKSEVIGNLHMTIQGESERTEFVEKMVEGFTTFFNNSIH